MRNFFFKLVWACALVVLFILGTNRAHADLIGTTVNESWYFPTTSNLFGNDGTKVVAPVASFVPALFFGEVVETVTANQIVIGFTTNSQFSTTNFNGPGFDFLHSGNLITGVTIDPVTNDGTPIVTLTSDGAGGQLIEVNLSGLLLEPGLNVTLDVSTDNAVPEPSTFALLGLGGIGLTIGAIRRRRATV